VSQTVLPSLVIRPAAVARPVEAVLAAHRGAAVAVVSSGGDRRPQRCASECRPERDAVERRPERSAIVAAPRVVRACPNPWPERDAPDVEAARDAAACVAEREAPRVGVVVVHALLLLG